MKTVCAGCGAHLLGDKDAAIVSHGFCYPCLRKLYPEFADEIIADIEKEKLVTAKTGERK